MTATEALRPPRSLDPYRVGQGGGHDYATGRGEGGPASKRVIVGYGFWIFLLSDFILFSGLFATYVIRTGQVIYIPAGTRHSLSNVASEVLEIFEIYTPAGRDFDFVIE